MEGGLEFRMLGPLEVVRDGGPVALGPRRQRAVLARLLIEPGRPVSVDRLIEDVWGGRPPDGALRTLRSYLSRLRASLAPGEVIVSRPPGYALDVDATAVDAARFEALAAEGRELLRRRNPRVAAVRLAEALALWRGAALADVPPEPFALAEAARLEEARLDALEDRIEADLALGRHAAVVGEVEALVAENPLRERLRAHEMVALYRAGRQADALEAFRRARACLDEQLGLDPSEELRRLEMAILRHELPEVEADVPHNLPASLTSFVGRERDVEALVGRVERERLMTVTGVGGAGKTRVALQTARELLSRFPDGVWLVDLTTLGDPGLLAQAVASVVEVRPGARGLDVDVLVDHLARLDVLLVLDNCEHVLEATARLVRRLLEGCPRLHVLATSREPLTVPGEGVFALPPLDAWPDPAAPAVRLFLERAPVAVDPGAVAAVADVCRELDGLPLAIEIAAAQTRLHSPEDIAARLGDRFRLLQYWDRTAPSRHQTLRASLDYSDALLEAPVRRVFHLLGVFSGSFGRDAAAAVASEAADVDTALLRLTDASLLQTAGRARSRMLQTVRQYALERLTAAGEADDARARHAAFFVRLAEDAAAAMDYPGQAEVFARLDTELADLRSALEWAWEADDHLLLAQLARGLGVYWRMRGYLEEAETWLSRAIARSGALADEMRADLQGLLGYALVRRSDYGRAGPLLTRAVELSEAGVQRSRWLHALAVWSRGQGDVAAARGLAGEALEICRVAGDDAGIAHHLGHLADLAAVDQRYDEAERLYEEAYEHVAPGAVGLIVPYLDSTARLALERGRLDEARDRAERGLAVARELGDTWHVALNLNTLAYLARCRGEAETAAATVLDSLEILQPLGEIAATAEALDVLAVVLLDGGEPDAAARLIATAAVLREQMEWPAVGADRQISEQISALARDPRFERAREAGRRMAVAEAVAFGRVALCDSSHTAVAD